MSATGETDAHRGAQALQPLDRFAGSLGQKVYAALRHAILTLELQPGEALRKPELCAHFGVSRSPVSDAMLRLAAEGLVDVAPQAGTFVARFSMNDLREGAFLREAIEVAAVERVASLADAAQIVQLRRALAMQAALVAEGDHAGFYALDGEMHEMLLSFTGYRRVAQVAQTAWHNVNRARRLILPAPGRVAATLDEHRAIVEAVAARDPDAARAAMRAHLRQLIRYLEPLERERPDYFVPS